MRRLPRVLLIIAVGVVSMFFLMAVRAVAIAGPEGATLVDSSSAAKVADYAVQLAFGVLSIFLMWGTNRIIRAIEKKWDVDIPERQEVAIDGWVEQGILWAEEKSRSKIKEKADKLRGPEKLEVALGYVIGMIRSRGWDTWAADAITAKIEARLGKHRANGGKPRLDAEDSPDLPVSE
jgi:hypothetical protein